MARADVEEVLNQVSISYGWAKTQFNKGDIDGCDKTLAELRDLLDDIYDRPVEEVPAG